jgi:hypothetical protein
VSDAAATASSRWRTDGADLRTHAGRRRHAGARRDVAERLRWGRPGAHVRVNHGAADLRELAGDLLVLFLYPHATGCRTTGPRLGPIPGARGCTAQSSRSVTTTTAELGAQVADCADGRRSAPSRHASVHYPLISDRPGSSPPPWPAHVHRVGSTFTRGLI